MIPTRERWPVLRGTLEALGRQDLSGIAAEVVVVDNGSRDGAREELERFAADSATPLALTVLGEPTPGAAAARNAGTGVARGGLILFLGDDCRPAVPRLVAGHLDAHRGGAPAAVTGRIDWDPALDRTEVMDWLVETGKMLDPARLGREPAGPWALYTGNLSLPRRSLLEVAGFDERFRAYGWEDLDLGLRLADRGVAFAYRPDLAVNHHHRYDVAQSLARMEAMGRGANLLHRLHDHRRPLPGPDKGRVRLGAGRALAPLVLRDGMQPAGPHALRRRVLQAAHLAAFARGYAAPPAPDDPELRGYGSLPPPDEEPRPPISVVVPFLGGPPDADALRAALASLRTAPGDELIAADNTPEGTLERMAADGVTVLPARDERSSYYARNVAAEVARGEWLLFLDADTRPAPSLLDDLLREPVEGRCAAVAGRVMADRRQERFVARYAASRGYLSQAAHMRDVHRPYGITANLLVRRSAWEGLGGFLEGIRSGGDADLCWRLQDAGWTIAYREPAAVEHRHRERVGALARQMARYSAAIAWMERRRPGSSPRPPVVRRLARSAAGALAWTLSGRLERAGFKALDGVVVAAEAVGHLLGNAAPSRPPSRAAPGGLEVVVVTDRFPELSETFVAAEAHALARAGHAVRVEASGRVVRPNRAGGRGLHVRYLEDDGKARKALDLAWLASRHPLRCARDLAARRRWRREEPVRRLRALAPRARRLVAGGRRPHLHAHFAAGAALDTLRLARVLGLRYSVTAHAYDIFQAPTNLREKLESAAFATTGCEYNVRHLRGVVGKSAGERIHEIVMGVDGGRFRRTRPHPGGRHVVAVGRLVEKKGFAHLVEAAGLLARRAPRYRLTIVGAGPLRDELRVRARELGLEDVVGLPGPRDPDAVRELLEDADLLAMPCVIAADGDRDSMPVVVKEALAMEVPVVASDEVGLPELVRPEWGKLVPPGDPEAIAAAIEELLALDPDERAAMGRAGREFVLEHCDVDAETARLAALIAAA